MSISATEVKKVLADAAINPRKDGPLSIILSVNNKEYYKNRALEFIMEDNLVSAISLLAMAEALNRGPQETTKRSRS